MDSNVKVVFIEDSDCISIETNGDVVSIRTHDNVMEDDYINNSYSIVIKKDRAVEILTQVINLIENK